MKDALFPGFPSQHITGDGAEIFVLTGGSGPPLLLLHGFPQNHANWHKVAPALAEHFTLVIPDLRGYGLSSCPKNSDGNAAYSKRAMGRDLFRVMSQLGHESFFVCGHDRGGRVAYRMALDQPDRIGALAVLDIVPTLDQWAAMDMARSIEVYHWPFLAQPFPLPETMIERDPVFYLDWTLASWTAGRDLSVFDPLALRQYRVYFANPDHIHAACNDYRAGATYDNDADAGDRAAGRKITCPTLALWGNHGIPGDASAGPLGIWQTWCENVTGCAIDSGHFLTEENPQVTASQLIGFFKGA